MKIWILHLTGGLGISQVIGLSASQVFYAVKGVKSGDPKDWIIDFYQLANFQKEQGNQFIY